MAHVEATTSVLHALKTLGVQLAIDDFGTGWSSLSYLRHFPIDALKIDKSFVQEITSRLGRRSIVSAVISMGKSLKHRVIAEGVETRDSSHSFRPRTASEGQGYYFSRPLAAHQFARDWQPDAAASRREASWTSWRTACAPLVRAARQPHDAVR